MKEYRKIAQFTYKGQKYNMYLDNNNKRFFMKVLDDGNLSYLSGEEMIMISKLFVKNKDVLKIAAKEKIVPKILTSAGAVLLTSSLLLSYLSVDKKSTEIITDNDSLEQTDEYDLLKYFSLSDDELNEDYYYDEYGNCLYIFNQNYLDYVLGSDEVTLDYLYNAIDENDNIFGEYKNLIKDYSLRLVNKYPNAELRIFYNNLKTLKINELTREEMNDFIGDPSCSGFYIRSKNSINVLEENNYEEGTWDFQVLYHELTHVVRNSKFDVDGMQVSVQIDDANFDNDMAEEALTTLFSLSLLNYDEYYRGYQTPSNCYSVMAECIDYDFTDYVNKSLSDFPRQLNEYNGDEEGDAEEILELISLQYQSYQYNDLEVEKDQFNPIIDYLCKMYFNKYILPDMGYDEAYIVASELENKLTVYTSSSYPLNTDRIYFNLDYFFNNYKKEGSKTL